MSAAIDAAPTAAALNAEQLAHFADVARAHERSPAPPPALGWLAYRSADFAGAIDWFRKAIGWGAGPRRPRFRPGPGARAQTDRQARRGRGRRLGLRREDPPTCGRSTSPPSSPNSPPTRRACRRRRLDRFIGLVVADRSSAGAQALGWRSPEGRQLRLCGAVVPQGGRLERRPQRGRRHRARAGAVAESASAPSRRRRTRLRLARPRSAVARALCRHRRRSA